MKVSEERKPLPGGFIKIITAWTSEVERNKHVSSIMGTDPNFVAVVKREFTPRRHVKRYVAEITLRNVE